MGHSVYLTLVNATKYDWVRMGQHSYQMNTWSFPERIPSRQTARVYVEWDGHIFHSKSDDAGEADYILEGNNNQGFQIQARFQEGYKLQVELHQIPINGNPSKELIDLDCSADVAFILSGDTDNGFTSNNLPTDWMQSNLKLLGKKTLRQICIPGSHDAGMSVRSGGTIGSTEGNTLTQSKNIAEQLKCGVRYFDVRPVIANGGKFLTGHYSEVEKLTWQGSNGESIQSIINGINTYTASNSELIVLDLSHTLNTEVGNSSYREFNKTEWDNLFKQLTHSDNGLKNLFVAPSDITDLTTLTLEQFIGNKQAAVVIVVSGADLGEFAGKGFYDQSQFPIEGEYANTDNLDSLIADQLGKMFARRGKNSPDYFSLSWTLTLQGASNTPLLHPATIKDSASKANPRIYDMLLPRCVSPCYPNILQIDYVKDSTIAALAMIINSLSTFQQDVFSVQDTLGKLNNFFLDTSEVVCPSGKIVTGFALYQKGGNRIAPKIWCTYPDGSAGEWIANPEWGDYFNPNGDDFYADTNTVSCLENQHVTGFAFCKKSGVGNRISLKIRSSSVDGHDAKWIESTTGNDQSYFGSLKEVFAETSELHCEKGYVVTGFSLWHKLNKNPKVDRLAPQMHCVSTSYQQEKFVKNDSFIGNLKDMYIDTSEVVCPSEKVVAGVAFYQKGGNRIAPKIWCAYPDGSAGEWVKNPEWNEDNYFGPLKDFYADTNEVFGLAGKYITGFAFCKKAEVGNRVSLKIRSSSIDGHDAQWIGSTTGNDPSYFGSLENVSVETSELHCEKGNVVTGFSLWNKFQKEAVNKLAPRMFFVPAKKV